MRRLEHELQLVDFRNDLEPSEREKERERVQQLLKRQKSQFQSFGRTVRENSARHPASLEVDKSALEFLHKRYPTPKRLSALEWLVISEWYGPRTQEAFLKIAFSMQGSQASPAREQAELLWIQSPFQKLAAESTDTFRHFQRWLRASEKTKEFVNATGMQTQSLDLSAFVKVDDQAEELFRLLKDRHKEGMVVVTTGEASAIMHRAIDLHPEMRDWEIAGWVNFNGRIYGLPAGPIRRQSTRDPVRDMEHEAISEFHRLHGETLLPPAPLGEGFPIVNLVSVQGEARPAANLRESIVPEGRSFLVESGKEAEAFRSTVLSVGREPASVRKADWKESPRIGDPAI